jgi:hypothetical protein
VHVGGGKKVQKDFLARCAREQGQLKPKVQLFFRTMRRLSDKSAPNLKTHHKDLQCFLAPLTERRSKTTISFNSSKNRGLPTVYTLFCIRWRPFHVSHCTVVYTTMGSEVNGSQRTSIFGAVSVPCHLSSKCYLDCIRIELNV